MEEPSPSISAVFSPDTVATEVSDDGAIVEDNRVEEFFISKRKWPEQVAFYRDVANLPKKRAKQSKFKIKDLNSVDYIESFEVDEDIEFDNINILYQSCNTKLDVTKKEIIQTLLSQRHFKGFPKYFTKRGDSFTYKPKQRKEIRLPVYRKGLKYTHRPQAFDVFRDWRAIPVEILLSSISQVTPVRKSPLYVPKNASVSVRMSKHHVLKKFILFLDFPPYTLYLGCVPSLNLAVKQIKYVLHMVLSEVRILNNSSQETNENSLDNFKMDDGVYSVSMNGKKLLYTVLENGYSCMVVINQDGERQISFQAIDFKKCFELAQTQLVTLPDKFANLAVWNQNYDTFDFDCSFMNLISQKNQDITRYHETFGYSLMI